MTYILFMCQETKSAKKIVVIDGILQYLSVGFKRYKYIIIIVFLMHVKLTCGLIKSCNLSDDRIWNSFLSGLFIIYFRTVNRMFRYLFKI